MFILHIQYIQFCRLIESIKNSKYLVGQRLVNYDPSRLAKSTTESPPDEQPVDVAADVPENMGNPIEAN